MLRMPVIARIMPTKPFGNSIGTDQFQAVSMVQTVIGIRTARHTMVGA
jgi:hypothetical protein